MNITLILLRWELILLFICLKIVYDAPEWANIELLHVYHVLYQQSPPCWIWCRTISNQNVFRCTKRRLTWGLSRAVDTQKRCTRVIDSSKWRAESCHYPPAVSTYLNSSPFNWYQPSYNRFDSLTEMSYLHSRNEKSSLQSLLHCCHIHSTVSPKV